MSNPSYRPIVYKTTDEGATWNIQPDFDFKPIPAFRDYLYPTAVDSTIFHPHFGEIQDVTVDANDNLHIASYVNSQRSIHIDSLDYTYEYSSIEGIFYDTYMTSNGNWNATIIDVQNTKDHVASDTTDLAISNRLQMGLSIDGKKIFYSWTDSDINQTTENILPDLYVTGRNIDSTYIYLENWNMTNGTILEYAATNHCMAPQVKENSTNFTFFNVITQFGTQPAYDAVNHYIIADIPLSLNNLNKYIANISNLYPNPTNGLTQVDVTLIKNADVSIQVVNMMGQVVSSQDYGYKTTGMHKLTINANNLTSGIYFVTVKAENSNSTGKMIVR